MRICYEHSDWKGDRDPLTQRIIACTLDVHRALGPGLLEFAYALCLAHEMTIAGLTFKLQHPIPVAYKGVRLDCGYRADFLFERKLLTELKAVEHLLGIHEAQLLTYMKLAKVPVGLLINFNVKLLTQGVRRMFL
jgi:GxxExxY protein